MDSPNEEPTTMDNCQGESEHSSLDEWTIIEDKAPSDQVPEESSARDSNVDEEATAAEEAREAIQILGETNFKEAEDDDENRIESLVTRDEASNDISVIADSDKGNHAFVDILSTILGSIDKIPQVGTIMHIIVACSLAAIVGFGIGRFVGTGKTQLSTNDVNFGHTESVEPFKRVDQLSTDSALPMTHKVLEQEIINNKKIPEKRPINMEHLKSNIGSFKNIFERVQFSLNTVCNLIKNSDDSANGICSKQPTIVDLVALNNNVKDLIMKSPYLEEISNQKFIQDMEFKIKNISRTFVDDLSRSLATSVAKMDRKINKARRKLHHRICLLRNTMSDDPKLQKILMEENMLSEDCKNITAKRSQNDNEERKHEKHRKSVKSETHAYPVGPDVKVRGDIQQIKIMNVEKNAKKQNIQRNDEFLKEKKKYKNRNDLSKGDFMPEESTDPNLMKERKIYRPLVTKDRIKKSDVKLNDNGQVCLSKSCSKERNYERKNSREKSKDDWQFKRSEGRHNWRAEKDMVESSWDYNRAKARLSARKNW